MPCPYCNFTKVNNIKILSHYYWVFIFSDGLFANIDYCPHCGGKLALADDSNSDFENIDHDINLDYEIG